MSYHSFFIGFVWLSLALAVGYLVATLILEKRGSVPYPLLEAYVALLVGWIYSVFAVCISTNWFYPVRVMAGLALGIAIGWALCMTAMLLSALFLGAIKLIGKIRQSR